MKTIPLLNSQAYSKSKSVQEMSAPPFRPTEWQDTMVDLTGSDADLKPLHIFSLGIENKPFSLGIENKPFVVSSNRFSRFSKNVFIVD